MSMLLTQVRSAKVIAGGRTQIEHAQLRAPSSAAKACYSVRELPNGIAELLDEKGNGCGLFSAKHLADRTAALLSR
jgi:hypothetical protein